MALLLALLHERTTQHALRYNFINKYYITIITMAPAVPETVLRKRKRDEQWAAKKAAAAAEVRSVPR